ncbi:MAG: hypothetical protein QOH56_2057 [Pseudonocardiales bacterium]|jgi:hypothetical protein|nr:uncharacterized protein [Frankiales bacterium]MDQ1690763.1 hypothetical protein [Pseudonocardiales bacterium]MDQ1735806.1 hypothetical protein [Pseudonocardiales bacterium]
MSSEWGRIDEAGTVFVKTAEGEREIGSWQAGDPEAGLAYYVRRFEDLETEVELLSKRLESGAGDAKATKSQAMTLHASLPTAAVLGDLASVDAKLVALISAADAKIGEQAEARDAARTQAIAQKEVLAAEAEQLAESSTQWKVAGDRLHTIVDEWKLIKGIDRKTDDALWKRFAAARDAFGKRRGSHFAQLDTERESAKSVKEELVRRAEELAASDDWRETSAALKELMTEWKAAPRANRNTEDALWKRFRAAQDSFFERRSGVFAERDAEQAQNLKEKEAIIAEANTLDISNPRQAQVALRDLQERLEAVGHVPRDAMRRTEDRMRAAEQRVREALDADWKRSSVESNPFLAQLRERLAEAEAKLERAKASGDAGRIAKAESDVAQRRGLLPE